MSTIRSAVEWAFNDITSYFSFLDLEKKNEDKKVDRKFSCTCEQYKCIFVRKKVQIRDPRIL